MPRESATTGGNSTRASGSQGGDRESTQGRLFGSGVFVNPFAMDPYKFAMLVAARSKTAGQGSSKSGGSPSSSKAAADEKGDTTGTYGSRRNSISSTKGEEDDTNAGASRGHGKDNRSEGATASQTGSTVADKDGNVKAE